MADSLLINESDEKALDSTSALEKVLRLDKKHTNFEYYDQVRSVTLRITYPIVSAEGPSSETLLKSLWKHASCFYFKKIEQNEYERLKYIQSVINSPREGSHRFVAEEEFWHSLTQLFAPYYLQRYLYGERDKQDYHNWLELLNLTWKVATTTDLKTLKKNQASFEVLNANLRLIHSNDDISLNQRLEQERDELGRFLVEEDDFGYDEVSQEIRRLQQEIQESNLEIRDIYGKLREKVDYETSLQQIIFCEGGLIDSAHQSLQQRSDAEYIKMARRLQRLEDFNYQTRYIEYIIEHLQKKQIAESASKLYRMQRHKGQYRIQLCFEEAMGIKPILLTEKQFDEVNKLREYSLLKYYNTASKSRYSFICQNYLGFKDIFENRNRPCRYKNRDMLDQMRRSQPDSINSAYYKQFNKMEICHHCRLLQHQDNLVTCEYSSGRFGAPVPSSPFYDSYVHQIIKNEQSRASAIRYMNSTQVRRNSYFYYCKENDELICGRKYCKFCLKNYEQSKDKSSGLCPYCREICYCTRCYRNDMIIRLKSMYILLGGDINYLQRKSIFQRYYQPSQDQQMDLRKKDKSGKISRKAGHAPARSNEKMLSIRFQLEDLRILCDIVKRRQKFKEKAANSNKLTFRKKIQFASLDFFLDRVEKNPSQASTVQQSKDDNLKLSQKLTKKLRRMIS